MTRQSNDDFDNLDNLDGALRRLFARAADDITPRSDVTDVTDDVEQSLAQVRGARPHTAGARTPIAATLSACLVVALLAGLFVWFRPAGLAPIGASSATPGQTPSGGAAPQDAIPIPRCGGDAAPWAPTPPPGTPDHSVVVNRSATANGITWHILSAYADATGTAVSYEILPNPHPKSNAMQPSQPVLVDGRGAQYPVIAGGVRSDFVPFEVFAPLPQDALGTPQTLTISTAQIDTMGATGAMSAVKGPWQISFTLTPVAGQSVPLHLAPVTHHGLTIQPLRVDVAPPGGGIGTIAGGVRLTVRFSGLDPRTNALDFGGFLYTYNLGGGSAACGGGALELIPNTGLPPMQPSWIVQENASPIQAVPNGTYYSPVGPSGTLDVEAIFVNFAPQLSSGTAVTLGIDRVEADTTVPGHAITGMTYHGPWTFPITVP